MFHGPRRIQLQPAVEQLPVHGREPDEMYASARVNRSVSNQCRVEVSCRPPVPARCATR